MPQVQMPTRGTEKLFRNRIREILQQGKKELNLQTEGTHCFMDELIKNTINIKTNPGLNY